jgi:hypothetical protein
MPLLPLLRLPRCSRTARALRTPPMARTRVHSHCQLQFNFNFNFTPSTSTPLSTTTRRWTSRGTPSCCWPSCPRWLTRASPSSKATSTWPALASRGTARAASRQAPSAKVGRQVVRRAPQLGVRAVMGALSPALCTQQPAGEQREDCKLASSRQCQWHVRAAGLSFWWYSVMRGWVGGFVATASALVPEKEGRSPCVGSCWHRDTTRRDAPPLTTTRWACALHDCAMAVVRCLVRVLCLLALLLKTPAR